MKANLGPKENFTMNPKLMTVAPPPLEGAECFNLRMIMHFLQKVTREGLLASEVNDVLKLADLIASAENSSEFAHNFPDEDLANFVGDNGLPLRGGRRLGSRYQTAKTPEAVLNQQREIFRFQTLPACAVKLHDMLSGRYYRQKNSDTIDVTTATYYDVTRRNMEKLLRAWGMLPEATADNED